MRFTLRVPLGVLVNQFAVEAAPGLQLAIRYNAAASQQIAVVKLEDGKQQLTTQRWGLIPSWAKDVKVGFSSINARADTVATKPAFRAAYKRRRCLVPADGYYEWKIEGKRSCPTCTKLTGASRSLSPACGSNFALCLGYEDLNDHEQLRRDPLLAVLVGRQDPTGQDRLLQRDRGVPLAGKSTLNRLELTPSGATDKSRYKKITARHHKIDDFFVETFLRLHPQPPAEITLTIGAWNQYTSTEHRQGTCLSAPLASCSLAPPGKPRRF